MTSPPWTGNAVFHWLLLAWPRINREAELGGFSCRSRDARFVFVELTVWGCLLTDGDRDGCVVTLCRAYVLSVPELVNMLLLIFFFKLLLFFYFFKFNQNNPNMSPENGRTLSSGETKQTCWLLACCVGSFATVKCSKPWCIMKKPEMRIHHQPHNDDSPWFIYYLWPWNLVPWASRLWTWPGQIFAAPPSVACGDVTLCFVINQRFLVNILNSLSEF